MSVPLAQATTAVKSADTAPPVAVNQTEKPIESAKPEVENKLKADDNALEAQRSEAERKLNLDQYLKSERYIAEWKKRRAERS